MRPIKVPNQARKANPTYTLVSVGPPQGISEDDCGTIESLQGDIVEVGSFDGMHEIRVYWEPTPEELNNLDQGSVVELVFIGGRIPMHYVGIV